MRPAASPPSQDLGPLPLVVGARNAPARAATPGCSGPWASWDTSRARANMTAVPAADLVPEALLNSTGQGARRSGVSRYCLDTPPDSDVAWIMFGGVTRCDPAARRNPGTPVAAVAASQGHGCCQVLRPSRGQVEPPAVTNHHPEAWRADDSPVCELLGPVGPAAFLLQDRHALLAPCLNHGQARGRVDGEVIAAGVLAQMAADETTISRAMLVTVDLREDRLSRLGGGCEIRRDRPRGSRVFAAVHFGTLGVEGVHVGNCTRRAQRDHRRTRWR